MSESPSTEKPQPQLSIKAFYLRHTSLETGLSPLSLRPGLTPEMKLELRVQINPLENQDEVVLDLTVTARDGSSLLYLIKMHQAGCFTFTDCTAEQKAFFLNTACANLLYPYACQKVNTLAIDAGFPPVNLLPIDFAHLYAQQQKASQEKSVDKAPAENTPSSS
jgi:preprotein translocase subunit SecB